MSFDLQTVATFFVLFISTLTRSTFGFGDALVGMPLLAIVHDDVSFIAPLMAIKAVTISLIIATKDRHRIDLPSASRLVIGAGMGIPIGVIFLLKVEASWVKLILAILILIFCLQSLFRRVPYRIQSEWPALGFGFLGGVLGGAYNTSGPPAVMFGTLRGWSPEKFRATLQGYFLPTGFLIAALHAGAGLWTQRVLLYYVASLPLVLAAIWLGRFLNQRFKPHAFVRVIHVLLMVISCGLIYTVLISW